MISKYRVIVGLVLLLLMIVATIYIYKRNQIGEIDTLSLSSDGRYVISTGEKEKAVLWDIKTKTRKIVARKVHVFSAYFIPGTDNYLWQDQHKVLHIRNIKGDDITDFKIPFYIDGIAMTQDRRYWLAGSIGDNLYYCQGKTCKRRYCFISCREPDTDSLVASKPVSLSLTPNQRYAVASQNGPVLMWNIRNGKLIRKYPGNDFQTFATLSPDGKYVVAGDSAGLGFVWNRKTGERLFDIAGLYLGRYVCDPPDKRNSKNCHFDKTGLIAMPKTYAIRQQTGYDFSLKFIDKTHYLLFKQSASFAVLFDVLNPLPIKYFDLGLKPQPSTYYYERDQSIDTSPSAHILVVGKAFEPGIMVYRYAPKHQTLTKVWDAK